jgi:hypothetical protein
LDLQLRQLALMSLHLLVLHLALPSRLRLALQMASLMLKQQVQVLHHRYHYLGESQQRQQEE